MVFLLVNTTSPNAQYFIPGGDPPGNFYLIFLFSIYNFSVYFDFVTKIEDCTRNGIELLVLLAFNVLLSLANLIVNCTVACRGKRPQKRSTEYNVIKRKGCNQTFIILFLSGTYLCWGTPKTNFKSRPGANSRRS